jgi:three-Cys-motif partner protein
VPVSSNEEFFRERRAQAVFKHGILTRYPVVFASKTGWKGRPVVFLDGYAGRGEYEDGTPGSPALLAETATRVDSFRDVTGIYVEKNRADFVNLKQVLARYDRPHDQILCGDLSAHLTKILAAVKGAALFAFLDPFGTALDRDQLVQQLLGRPGTAPVEVLLHISISTVARLGGLLRRRRIKGVELSTKDQRTIDHANRFLGGEWWQRHFEPVHDASDQERATEAALRVANEYQAAVCKVTGFMAVSMPIRPKPTLLPKYVLVLFTRHVDGLWYFADAVGKAGREWQGAWRTDVAKKERAKTDAKNVDQLSLFDDDALPPPTPFDPDRYEQDNREAWQRIIADNIQRLLDTRDYFVLATKVDDVYGSVLGAASERHVRAAIKMLHRAGIVTNKGIGQDFYKEMIRRAA